MIWAYVLENQGVADDRSNQPIFQLINQLQIEDDYLIFDNDIKRPELLMLLDRIEDNDRLIIRSAEDLADTLSDLVDILGKLTDKKISLCSCKEPFLSGEDYLDYLNGYVELYVYYSKKKKEIGYQQAVAEGRVGRPATSKDVEQAIAMHKSGNFMIAQIEAITGVSKSTLYRYLNKTD